MMSWVSRPNQFEACTYHLCQERKGSIIMLACFLSIFTSCLLFGLPWLASCRPCPSDPSESFPTFVCLVLLVTIMVLLASFFNTKWCNLILFTKGTDSDFLHSSMLILFSAFFFLSVFSYGIVAPAGLFVLVTCAAYRRFVGMLLGLKSNRNHGFLAVLGSASLRGSIRTTISLCIIRLELTHNLL